MGKASDHFKEIRDTIGTNKSCKNGHSKGQKQRDLKKKKRLSGGGKNTQKNYTKKILMTQITMMV